MPLESISGWKLINASLVRFIGGIVAGFNVIYISLKTFRRILIHLAVTSHPLLMPLIHGCILESATCDLKSQECHAEKHCKCNMVEMIFGNHASVVCVTIKEQLYYLKFLSEM